MWVVLRKELLGSSRPIGRDTVREIVGRSENRVFASSLDAVAFRERRVFSADRHLVLDGLHLNFPEILKTLISIYSGRLVMNLVDVRDHATRAENSDAGVQFQSKSSQTVSWVAAMRASLAATDDHRLLPAHHQAPAPFQGAFSYHSCSNSSLIAEYRLSRPDSLSWDKAMSTRIAKD